MKPGYFLVGSALLWSKILVKGVERASRTTKAPIDRATDSKMVIKMAVFGLNCHYLVTNVQFRFLKFLAIFRFKKTNFGSKTPFLGLIFC